MRVARLLVTIGLCTALAACGATTATTRTTTTPPAGTQKPATPAAATNATAPAPVAPPAPRTLMATSADGTRIAYEVTGSGPALLLVHGGGQTRRTWQQLGYIDRLSKRFTVIAFDQRGIGESDKPLTLAAYALDRLLEDFTAVADAAKAPRFHIWGFGQGATIGRYLAARSDRVLSAVLVGTTMGPAATGVFKDAISGMKTKWQEAIAAQAAGNLDAAKLSPNDRAAWEGGMAVTVLSLTATLDYPPLEPDTVKAPTLWAVGSEDSAMENVKQYEGKLAKTQVTFKSLSSVNYSDSFIKVDQVLGEVEPFLLKAGGTP